MKSRPIWCVVMAAAMVLAAAQAAAHGRDQKHFEKLYYDFLVPDTDLYYVASCKVCHVNKRKLNSYGRALRRAIKAGMDDKVEIYLAVEDKDSDYDGVSNGEEIRLGFKPGDADSRP